MNKTIKITFILLLITHISFAQKKILDHKDFDIWNVIKNKTISPNGKFVMYSLEKGERDNHLIIKDAKATSILEHERSEKGQFSYNSKFALFTIKACKDSIVEMKRRKVKKDKLPKDTLGIYNLEENTLTKIANVKSYKIPEKWSGYVAYYLEEIKKEKEKSEEKDSISDKKDKKKKKDKKVGKDNGYHLVLRNLLTQKQDTFKYVTDFTFAKKEKRFAFTTTGQDSIIKAGVFVLNLEDNKLTKIHEAEKDRKSTRLNSSHVVISYAVFCLKKKNKKKKKKEQKTQQ